MAETEDSPARRIGELGPLHDLLLKAAPTAEAVGIKGKNPKRRSITTLAVGLGIKAWSIYVWIDKGKLPPKRATEIVELSDGRVTLEEFHPFVYS